LSKIEDKLSYDSKLRSIPYITNEKNLEGIILKRSRIDAIESINKEFELNPEVKIEQIHLSFRDFEKRINNSGNKSLIMIIKGRNA
jgi:hypothetical protein